MARGAQEAQRLHLQDLRPESRYALSTLGMNSRTTSPLRSAGTRACRADVPLSRNIEPEGFLALYFLADPNPPGRRPASRVYPTRPQKRAPATLARHGAKYIVIQAAPRHDVAGQGATQSTPSGNNREADLPLMPNVIVLTPGAITHRTGTCRRYGRAANMRTIAFTSPTRRDEGVR